MKVFRKIMLLVSTVAGTAALVKPEWGVWLAPIAALAANFNGGTTKQNAEQ